MTQLAVEQKLNEYVQRARQTRRGDTIEHYLSLGNGCEMRATERDGIIEGGLYQWGQPLATFRAARQSGEAGNA